MHLVAYYKSLGENIAFYFKRKKMPQMELCEAANTSRNHLSHIENAACAVSLDTVFAIAAALGVETYKLFQSKD